MSSRLVLLVVLAALATPLSAAEDDAGVEAGRIGLTVSPPLRSPSIGLLWHVSDRVALEPHAGFRWTSTPVLDESEHSFAAAVALRFYLRRNGRVTPYLTARVSFERHVVEGTQTAGSNNEYGARGGAGLQYAIHRHVAAFAEAGLGYVRAYGGDRWSLSTATSRVGLVVYLK